MDDSSRVAPHLTLISFPSVTVKVDIASVRFETLSNLCLDRQDWWTSSGLHRRHMIEIGHTLRVEITYGNADVIRDVDSESFDRAKLRLPSPALDLLHVFHTDRVELDLIPCSVDPPKDLPPCPIILHLPLSCYSWHYLLKFQRPTIVCNGFLPRLQLSRVELIPGSGPLPPLILDLSAVALDPSEPRNVRRLFKRLFNAAFFQRLPNSNAWMSFNTFGRADVWLPQDLVSPMQMMALQNSVLGSDSQIFFGPRPTQGSPASDTGIDPTGTTAKDTLDPSKPKSSL